MLERPDSILVLGSVVEDHEDVVFVAVALLLCSMEVRRCTKRFADALPSDLDVGGSNGYAGLGVGDGARIVLVTRWIQ